MPYSFFIFPLRERTRHREWHCRFTWNRQRASSEGCKITLAKSSGWSHHKEDKTKGHSQPWIICCCHPTPSHNPSLCDSLFWSYVMNGRLWAALSIILPQYSDNANILWPWSCPSMANDSTKIKGRWSRLSARVSSVDQMLYTWLKCLIFFLPIISLQVLLLSTAMECYRSYAFYSYFINYCQHCF